VLSVN